MRRRLVVLAVLGAALWAAPGAFAAGWCGTGESPADLPDIVTGPQIHAIYALPSDGPDTFATGAPLLADDIASITGWWQGQDPTRVPRFDQASFNGATCADISFVRLPDPTSSWADIGRERCLRQHSPRAGRPRLRRSVRDLLRLLRWPACRDRRLRYGCRRVQSARAVVRGRLAGGMPDRCRPTPSAHTSSCTHSAPCRRARRTPALRRTTRSVRTRTSLIRVTRRPTSCTQSRPGSP